MKTALAFFCALIFCSVVYPQSATINLKSEKTIKGRILEPKESDFFIVKTDSDSVKVYWREIKEIIFWEESVMVFHQTDGDPLFYKSNLNVQIKSRIRIQDDPGFLYYKSIAVFLREHGDKNEPYYYKLIRRAREESKKSNSGGADSILAKIKSSAASLFPHSYSLQNIVIENEIKDYNYLISYKPSGISPEVLLRIRIKGAELFQNSYSLQRIYVENEVKSYRSINR